jgi:hypothetical protein
MRDRKLLTLNEGDRRQSSRTRRTCLSTHLNPTKTNAIQRSGGQPVYWRLNGRDYRNTLSERSTLLHRQLRHELRRDKTEMRYVFPPEAECPGPRARHHAQSSRDGFRCILSAARTNRIRPARVIVQPPSVVGKLPSPFRSLLHAAVPPPEVNSRSDGGLWGCLPVGVIESASVGCRARVHCLQI